jgi:hypothetical protein
MILKVNKHKAHTDRVYAFVRFEPWSTAIEEIIITAIQRVSTGIDEVSALYSQFVYLTSPKVDIFYQKYFFLKTGRKLPILLAILQYHWLVELVCNKLYHL